ncbi:DUF4395 family protein [Niallia taxi]|uniref:DUF4395 family protein n=1 Tax=Niallia taxi TaxID=2499688 RepID=UPI003D2AF44B
MESNHENCSYFPKKKRSEYIAEDWDQQAFNQIIAVICLAGAVLSFQLGWSILGTAFTIMVGLASIIAILGFCIGCFIRFLVEAISVSQECC